MNGFCADSIDLIDAAGSVENAILAIKKHQPHLVFLDITLGSHVDGAFDILKAFKNIDFKVVFTTSSKQSENILMALNKYGAKKYLLKPLEIDEVIDSVNLVKEEVSMKLHEDDLTGIKTLINATGAAQTHNKIPFPVKNGIQYVSVEDIVMFRSDLNAVMVFFNDGTNIRTSRNLKHFEENYLSREFIRVSRSYIINKKYVQNYSSEDGGTIHLACSCSAALSKNDASGFFAALGR
jgi:two-component system LytT family response regulator